MYPFPGQLSASMGMGYIIDQRVRTPGLSRHGLAHSLMLASLDLIGTRAAISPSYKSIRS